jgi:hypothetical protein
MNYFKKRKLQRIVLKEYEDAIDFVNISKKHIEQEYEEECLNLVEIKEWLTEKNLSIGICYFLQFSGMYGKYKFNEVSTIFPKLFFKKNKKCDALGNTTSRCNLFFYKTPINCDNISEIIECLDYRRNLLEKTLKENSLLNELKNFLIK